MDCPDPVRVYDTHEAKAWDMPCRRRRCGVCGPKRWRPRKLATLHAGLHGDPAEYLVLLLTAPGDAGDPEEWNAGASRRWNHWITALHQEFPEADLQYWRVAELQQRGHVHYHVVLRGLRYLPVEVMRSIALRAGFGLWVGIRRPDQYRAGLRGLGGYLGKYLLKDAARVLPARARLVTMSQRWLQVWTRVQRRRAEPGRCLLRFGRIAPWDGFTGPVEALASPRRHPRADWLTLGLDVARRV